MRTLITVLLLAVALVGQAPCTAWPVEGAKATAVGVLWRRGYDQDAPDERGLAEVLADVRLAHAREAAPGLLASGARVGGDYSLAFAVVGPDDVRRATAFVAALLATETPASDDDLRLVIARAALDADDALYTYPGTGLLAIGRGVVREGPALQPVGGIPTDLQRLTPARVRRALREPADVAGAALGAVGAELGAALAALPWPPPAEAPPTSAPQGELDGALARWQEHPRVDSPFVATAFAAPSDELPAFALAIEVARARLGRSLPLRGSELRARAPLVSWSWLERQAIVQFCRRGEDFVSLLPGERPAATAEDEAEATRAELAAALRDLRERAPSEAELRGARSRLQAELSLAAGAGSAWSAEPMLYPGRLMALLLRERHGIDVAALDEVDADAVARQLQRFEPTEASWYGFVPAPRSDVAFRAR